MPAEKASAPPPSPSSQPTHIGPYRILDTLGEGGMGTVYLAEQQEPVKRKVALKLIKLGMDSKTVVARFKQEEQALAMMQHDGIAKIHDCGTSERGQPYFVMEYVKGIPLTDFCDQNRLSLPDRIQLMRQVCAAVTHAHQKGVVHRDLKPGNVLVSDEGGKVQSKIIDFGLAKAMGQKLVEATLFTAAGHVVGTPEYMAPEQADPTNADIDTRADVYSLGVMLYEVLVGSLPFPQHELRRAGMLEVQRILREVEPPRPSTKLTTIAGASTAIAHARRTSVGALHRALKTDLDWVVLKALEKDRNRRYDTANALAADLQRFLDHEPLVAGPPSAGYRPKKLLRRYRGQVLAGSAVLATAVVGAIVALDFALASGKLAQEKGELAVSEHNAKEEAQKNAGLLRAKVDEFDQLAGVVQYDRAITNEKDLYPPWPAQIPAMERWLRDDAGKLLDKKKDIEQTVRDLESRALPQTDEERQADRKSHPQFAAFEGLGKKVTALQRAQAIRDGKEKLVAPELPADVATKTANDLNTLAWDRVAPKAEDRKVYGEEAFGLACARAAVAKAAATPTEHQVLDTLAWALLANGQDAEARQRSADALAKAPAAEQEGYRGYQRDLETAIGKAGETLAGAEKELMALTEEVSRRRTFRFELESQRFLHDTLQELLLKLASLEAKEKAEVDRRLSWAQQIGELTKSHPNAKHTWAEARTAIARADDVEGSKLYRGQTIELRDVDVMGLVPIGMNPVTKLWEFYELRSAWDGKGDPAAIAIPEHKEDGSIQMTGDTGIVFVLLPGGMFTMGAQKRDKDGSNYDVQALDSESPPHEVTLAPFFLSRHEMTQGQWGRLWSGDESLRQPSQYKAGQTNFVGKKITLANPVEQVDWTMCGDLLRRHGLVLPTESQWEYGCRAGTTTPWICDLDELGRYANVADLTAKRAAPQWGAFEDWTDGHIVHAPVGSFRPNAFGLYDMHGNVLEWCLDEYGSYGGAVRPGDGLLLQGGGSSYRCIRGGCFINPAAYARSASRSNFAEAFRCYTLGARVARASRLDH